MDININEFHNKNTLNIFTDASIGKNNTGCYGAIAVVGDDIVDREYKMVSNTTNNNSEIKGIRAGLCLAMKYRFQFANINIFSDSLISINGLRTYIYTWKEKDGLLYSKIGKPISNQSIFIECHGILKVLDEAPCMISLYHQSAHINNNYNELIKASNSFKKNNTIRGKIDLNFIRYICTWNNYVDNTSRGMVRRNATNENIYMDPIEFIPINDWL